MPDRAQHEAFVGSSLQFQLVDNINELASEFISSCEQRGVEIKWFGEAQPKAFTSRYDSWRYLGDQPELTNTLAVLATTFDVRLPLTFSENDCELIGRIIVQEVENLA